jgi:pimeloyl-ACP methyl ester carboxylesterase
MWRGFANLLRADGHEVCAPSLTGLGERVHLAGPDVDLTTHVTDVENVFKYEGLEQVVLVGHSYGGMVVTGVADRVPEMIRHLVYLDAFLPRDGESCFDLGGAGGQEGAQVEDGWKVIVVPPPPEDAPEEVKESVRLLSAQPIKTLQEPVSLKTPLEDRDFNLTYIKATEPPREDDFGKAFWAASDRTKDDPHWRHYVVDSGHVVQYEVPRELADILIEVSK